jgi:DNA-directed RNA polymerase subunit RPC12/RpoP
LLTIVVPQNLNESRPVRECVIFIFELADLMPILEIRQCMGEAVHLKMTCLKCGGSVEFPEESEGATVVCPHCGKDLFLYRGVLAAGTAGE